MSEETKTNEPVNFIILWKQKQMNLLSRKETLK